MTTWSDAILTQAARLTDYLGPLTTLLDSVVDRLAGKHVAQACGGALCFTWCDSAFCGGNYVRYKHYVYSTISCSAGAYTCAETLCGCYG